MFCVVFQPVGAEGRWLPHSLVERDPIEFMQGGVTLAETMLSDHRMVNYIAALCSSLKGKSTASE